MVAYETMINHKHSNKPMELFGLATESHGFCHNLILFFKFSYYDVLDNTIYDNK